MSKAFENKSMSPESTTVQSAKHTLTATKGNSVFKVWVLTKHIILNSVNIVVLELRVYDKSGKVVHTEHLEFPL